MSTPEFIYANPGGSNQFVNLRSADGEDLGDSPRGSKWQVTGESDISGVGPAWQVAGYIAKSVASLTPPASPALILPQMAWPVLDGERIITDRFNSLREYANRKHEGIDFRAFIGYTVVPLYDGIVHEIRQTGFSATGYGKYVIVRHEIEGRVYYSWYCHMRTVVVRVSDPVRTGETRLGDSGNTGTVAAHLHVNFVDDALAHGDSRGYYVPGVIDFLGYLPKASLVI